MICNKIGCLVNHQDTFTGGSLESSFTVVNSVSEPKTCPNCDGHGNREKLSFYLNPTLMKCWSCNGTGVVWK